MQNTANIDVHCHFFNVQFAVREFLEIGWRRLNGKYPYTSDELFDVRAFAPKTFDPRGFVEYIVSLLVTATGSPEENYRYEQDCHAKSESAPSRPLVTVPLMMDIFFAFDDGLSQKRKTRIREMAVPDRKAECTPLSLAPGEADAFDAFARDMRRLVIEEYERGAKDNNAPKGFEAKRLPDVSGELDRAIESFRAEALSTVSMKARPSGGNVQMTRGYEKHLKELRTLRGRHPDTVFPFLAVDPRRIGIEKLVLDQVVRGGFTGVKLYCPLGYLPSHPDLHPVYRLCIRHGIPVTAHTSPGGFPSQCNRIETSSRKKDGRIVSVVFDKKACQATRPIKKGEHAHSLFFADPENWKEVLESDGLEGLHINLAHFGGEKDILAFAEGSAEADNWTARIIELMETYDHVYADISYCPNGRMVQAIQSIVRDHPVVGTRLMFGTDFVMLMQNTIGLRNYFRQYTCIPSGMLTKNPRAFLHAGRKSPKTRKSNASKTVES